MKKENHRLLLEQAARATMERIRLDREKAPDKFKHLFFYLEDNLFDRNLDINQMRRDCRIRDNSLSIFFTEVAGTPPQSYILERRMETAAALIRDTDIPMWNISKLIGFSQQTLLTRNFRKRYEMTPMAFRSGIRAIIAEAGGRPTAEMPSVDELRKAVSSGIKSQDALEIIMRIQHSRLQECTPAPTTDRGSQRDLPLEKLTFSDKTLESIKAEVAWEFIREKPWAEQRAIIRERLKFSTPALFHHLRNKCIPEGRNDRKFGVHLAELAMQALSVTEYVTGKELLNLRAQGWVWLGNARRLTDDLNGADAAFSIAEAYLVQEIGKPSVRAEYYSMKTSLRLWQRKTEEACELNARALSMFRDLGETREIATSLIIGAFLHQRTGNDDLSIAYSNEALELLRDKSEYELEFAATLNLTSAYVKIGSLEQAKELLPQVYKLRSVAHVGVASLHFLQWLEGRLSAALNEPNSAAALYEVARDGFLNLDQNIHAALVSLDFALHCWEQDHFTKVKELALGIIPLLEACQFHEEAVSGLRLLQSALENDALTRTVLQELRESLEKIRVDPWD